MGKEDKIYSKEEFEAKIAILERRLVGYVLKAAIQDGLGDWKKAECLIDDANWVMLEIGYLESTCSGVETREEPTPATTPIGPITIGDFSVITSTSPPPYGEFTTTEFTVEHVTEVTTT